MQDITKPYKVTAGDFIFYFNDEEIAAADLIQKSPTEFNCIKDHCSVNAVLVTTNSTNKKCSIAIDGETFLIEIKDELDQVLDNMGFGLKPGKVLTNIKAPMPGLVLEIAVSDGQAVNAGDKILILEAMKMENSIAIPVNAVIKKILVAKGQAVDRGQVLVELSPL